MLENASPLEIGIFLASVVGDVKSLGLTIDAIKDMRALDGPARKSTTLGQLAWARLWTDLYALYVFVVFTWIGARAMTLPPTDADNNGIPDLVSLFILLCFLGIVAFLLLLVFFLSWSRQNVQNFVAPAPPWDRRTERRQPVIGAAGDEGGFSP